MGELARLDSASDGPGDTGVPWLVRTPAGALALVVAGIVAAFVLQLVGQVPLAIWLVRLAGELLLDPRTLEDVLIPLLPFSTALLPLAALAVLGVLRLAGQLAPAPPTAPASRAFTWTLAALGAGLVGAHGLSFALRRLGLPPTEQPLLARAFAEGPLLSLAFSMVILAPIGEELLFRRFAFATLRIGAGRAAAYSLTALGFALVHLNPSALPIYLWLGLCAAFAYERTGRTVAPVVVHASNNLMAVLVLRGVLAWG